MIKMRRHFSDYVFYFCIFLFIASRQLTSASNSTDNDSGPCSNHCSQQDSDNACWNKTEKFYDVTLINALNDWVTVQIQIDQWNQRHSVSSPPANATEITLARMSSSLSSDSIIDVQRLQEIIPSLLNLTYTRSPAVMIVIPEFVCPIPCKYDSQLWEYLFIASILVNIAMLLVVIPFIIKSERRDKQLYAKQISMMQMLKPTSKSRNPSAS